jgi:hypothetical protein
MPPGWPLLRPIPCSNRSTNKARRSSPQRNQHEQTLHRDKRRPHSPHPEKRHAELDRILDMITRPLTPRH